MRYFPIFFLVVAATCVAIDYSVFIVDSPVTNDVILPGRPLPEACRPGKVLTIEACPGEYEPASFLVITPEPLESVRIEVAPLSGEAGALPADCIDVRIVKRWQTSGPIEDLKPPPRVLVKNDAVLVGQLAPTADNPQRLINVAPNGLRDTAQLQPCLIDQLKQFEKMLATQRTFACRCRNQLVSMLLCTRIECGEHLLRRVKLSSTPRLTNRPIAETKLAAKVASHLCRA